jgi:L-prolyl-PCP dehydrogenase
MDFELSPMQRDARTFDEVRARLGSHWPNSDPAVAHADWKPLAEIGQPGLCVPRDYGGAGLGALDTALCLEALKRSAGPARTPV